MQRKRIAFLANYEKTICFHGVATRLAALGHDVSWISPSRRWARWLVEQGAPPEADLDVSRWGPEWSRGDLGEGGLALLAELEEKTGIAINDVILMDRVLRDRAHGVAQAHLAVAAREIGRFLDSRAVGVVFSEQTFGIELVTAMVCRAAGRTVLAPHLVRIPAGRSVLFPAPMQETIVPLRDVSAGDRDEARDFLAAFRRDRPRPEYFARNAKAPLPHRSWPAKLWKHMRLEVEDPHDATHFSPAWLVRQRSQQVLFAAAHRIASPFSLPREPPRPFILFPLHRQPEASLDVLASRLSNQEELIRALARTLPVTHDLYVKEHPLGLGDRSPTTLRAIRAIPGVRLIAPGVSTFALAQQAALIVTVAGTAAYEAALLGHRAVTMVPLFFSSILAAPPFNPYADSLADLLRTATLVDDERIVELMAAILSSSFHGFLDNPNFSPQVLEPANLDGVAGGLAAFLRARTA